MYFIVTNIMLKTLQIQYFQIEFKHINNIIKLDLGVSNKKQLIQSVSCLLHVYHTIIFELILKILHVPHLIYLNI